MSGGLERRAQRLMELSRAGDDPSASQLLSLHGSVAARIAAEGSATAGATAGSKVGGAGGALKGLVAAGVLAAGVAGFFALTDEAQPPAPPVARALPPRPSPPLPVSRPEPPPATVASAPAPPPVARANKAPVGLRLQDEAALLAEVQRALRSGNPQVALGQLDAYDRRFPSGGLRAEADAAKVFALCASGRVEKARASALRFVKRYPGSPAVARVQAACK